MSKPLFGASELWPTFHAVNDTLRGGSSSSSWLVDDRTNFATFKGHLDITTLGGAGFASQSTLFPSRLSLPRSRTSGLLLTYVPPPPSSLTDATAGGPGPVTRFVLALKTSEPARRPDGRRESVTVYEWAFDASDHLDGLLEGDVEGEKGEKGEKGEERSVTRLARWDEFKPMYRGRPADDAEPFDPARIYELSFMARSHFGDQAGDFALDVVSLSAAAFGAAARTSTGRGWLGGLWDAVRAAWASWTATVRALWSGERGGALRLP
ncbi:hypothetical protein JCM3775_003681 [Rhodotorula graminis]